MVYKQNGQRSRRLKNPVGRIGAAVLLTYTLPLDEACLREACGTGHPTTHLKIPVIPRCKASKRGLPDESACTYPYSRPVCMTFDGGLPHDVLTSDRLSSKPTTLLRNARLAWLCGGHNGCTGGMVHMHHPLQDQSSSRITALVGLRREHEAVQRPEKSQVITRVKYKKDRLPQVWLHNSSLFSFVLVRSHIVIPLTVISLPASPFSNSSPPT